MKQISAMELRYILEALSVANDELDAAVEDGWVLTTDVEDMLDGTKRLVHSIINSTDIEIAND